MDKKGNKKEDKAEVLIHILFRKEIMVDPEKRKEKVIPECWKDG